MTTINVDISDIVRAHGRTGIQRVLREIASRLVANPPEGFTVRILTYDYQKHHFVALAREDALATLFHDAPVVATATVKIEDFGPDDIFYDIDAVWTSPLKRPYLYKRLKQQGVTIFCTLYDFSPILFPAGAYRNTRRNWPPFIAAVYAYADLVFFDSRDAERDFEAFRRRLGVERSIPTVVTKLGGDFTVATPPTSDELRPLEAFLNEPFVLFVGSVEPRKLHGLTLDALERVFRERPDVHLVFAGKIGWNSGEINRRIAEHPLLNRRVHWVSFPPDSVLQLLYERCTLAIYLSRHEGFGLPVVEALSHAKVSIVSQNSSIYEVGHGFADYVHYNAPSELAETLLVYLNDPTTRELREQQIRSGYHAYSWDLVGGTVRHVFQGLRRADQVARRDPITTTPAVVVVESASAARTALASLDTHADFVERYLIAGTDDVLEALHDLTSGRPWSALPTQEPGRDAALRAASAALGEDTDFLFFDADSVAIDSVDPADFVGSDGRYRALYCGDLTDWPHHREALDLRLHRTREMLDLVGLETLSYAASQPQLINGGLLAEAIEFFGETASGCDLLSAYFDYATTRYPTVFRKNVFETLNWPTAQHRASDRYTPERYLFEAHRGPAYEPTGIFAALSPTGDAPAKRLRKNEEIDRASSSAQLMGELRRVIPETDSRTERCDSASTARRFWWPAYRRFWWREKAWTSN